MRTAMETIHVRADDLLADSISFAEGNTTRPNEANGNETLLNLP